MTPKQVARILQAGRTATGDPKLWSILDAMIAECEAIDNVADPIKAHNDRAQEITTPMHRIVEAAEDNQPPRKGSAELRLHPHDGQVIVHFGDHTDVAEAFANWADDEESGMWEHFRRHLASIHPTAPQPVIPDINAETLETPAEAQMAVTRPDLIPAAKPLHDFQPSAKDRLFCAHCDKPRMHRNHPL